MNVTFHSCQNNLSCLLGIPRLLSLKNRLQNRNGTLHGSRSLHHLRQKHFTRAKKVTNNVHTIHKWFINNIHRTWIYSKSLSYILIHIITDSFHQCMTQSLIKRQRTPLLNFLFHLFRSISFKTVSIIHHSFSGIITSVKDNIFSQFSYIIRNIIINQRLRRVNNTHIHSGLYGAIQKHRVHHFTHIIVAAKRKRKIAHSPTHLSSRQVGFYPLHSFNKVYRIVLMLFDTCGNSQYIGVKNYILRIKMMLHKQVISSFANLNSALISVSLTCLVKSHHHHCCTVRSYFFSLLQKLLFTIFQRNRVYHTLTLRALQSRLNNFPFRRVNHNWHTRHIRIGSQQIKEIGHLLHPVQQTIVHIYIYNLCAIFYLLLCNLQSLLVVFLLYQTKKSARTCHITSLTDIHKVQFGRQRKLLQSRQSHQVRLFLRHRWFHILHHGRVLSNMLRRCAATTTNYIHQSLIYKLLHLRCHQLRCFIIFTQLIRQSGIWIHTQIKWRNTTQLLHIWLQI